MKTTTWIIALAVAAAMALPMAPLAQAHTCAAYHGCDANACTEGEDHDHTNYNSVGRDEHCKSERPPPPEPEGSCKYFGITWPSVVCDLIEESTGTCAAASSDPQQFELKIPDGC